MIRGALTFEQESASLHDTRGLNNGPTASPHLYPTTVMRSLDTRFSVMEEWMLLSIVGSGKSDTTTCLGFSFVHTKDGKAAPAPNSKMYLLQQMEGDSAR